MTTVVSDTPETDALQFELLKAHGIPTTYEARALQKCADLERRLRSSYLTTEIEALKQEVKSLRAFKASVDEALNSGDGSYRP